MRTPVLLPFLLCASAFAGTVTVTNPDAAPHPATTVEISASGFAGLGVPPDPAALVVRDASGKIVASQAYDADGDGKPDTLLFQTDLAPGATATFAVDQRKAGETVLVPVSKAHARFVPERMDDFAWENDRVAHRVYGPTLGEKRPKGEYSQISGVDVWVKSVPDLVVDRRYKRNDYHRDHGDGMDCYDVGRSRGCGGDAVLAGGKWYPAGNYKTWKRLADGPIRAAFELVYDIDVAGRKLTETKRFELDAGSDFTRVTTVFTGDAGEPLHFGVGVTRGDWKGRKGHSPVPFALSSEPDAPAKPAASGDGFVADWQPNGGKNGFTGVAAVVPGGKFEPAEGHWFLAHDVRPGESTVAYLGSAWSKAPYYPTKDAWSAAVAAVAKAKPPVVTYAK